MFLLTVFQLISLVFGQIDSDNVRAQIGFRSKQFDVDVSRSRSSLVKSDRVKG